MARNSRHFETTYDVLTALEEVITDALDQSHPPINPNELDLYLLDHFDATDVIYAWRVNSGS